MFGVLIERISSVNSPKGKSGHGSEIAIIYSFQIAGILTLPFDVIKTHRQIELGQVVLTKGRFKPLLFSIYLQGNFQPVC